ncbi:MAG TPA: radical SAM protein [Methylomirabilota bacterium]|nr:radical SAM protein [Methylomirabilota bacterium]
MTIRSRLRHLAPWLSSSPVLRSRIDRVEMMAERARTALTHRFPVLTPLLIRPTPRSLQIAVTAHCNLRCVGCRYGRDFMPGRQLSLSMVRDLLDDARSLGVHSVRFYGGEPLLHPDLAEMIAHAVRLDVLPWVTTNGILLADTIDSLYAAGLRRVRIGFYGVGAKYDDYVQRRDRFRRLEEGVAAVRRRYGSRVYVGINWLLMRPSCNLEDLHAAWEFAERYSTPIQVDLVHYSLPYFSEGPDRALQFRLEDRSAVDRLVAELLRLKARRPELITQSMAGLRSIPDWLMLGPAMRVPCDFRDTLWIGADGTVQLCYVTFRLGNLHQQRLRSMLFGAEHHRAACDSFRLNCPNCHCNYDRRVQKYAPANERYSRPLTGDAPSGSLRPAGIGLHWTGQTDGRAR